MAVQPRVVLVTRPTELTELLNRHGTLGQAQFFLEQRNQSLDGVERRHALQSEALAEVERQIPTEYRRSRIQRADLDRWLFEPDDIVVVVGQDGLVSNVAKYLDEQVVIGVNPNPAAVAGVLVRHRAEQLGAQLQMLSEGHAAIERRTMVQATLDDGQRIAALNEVFVGVAGHQSARYEIGVAGEHEVQSSSGLVIGTGTGSTGWCASLWRDRRPPWNLPTIESNELAWFVREAWPSGTTGSDLTGGLLAEKAELTVTSTSDRLVVFGDGIETDHLDVRWGQTITVSTATRTLRLCVQDLPTHWNR